MASRCPLFGALGLSGTHTTPYTMVEFAKEELDVFRKSAPVDGDGRVSIGAQYSGKKVTVAVQVEDEDDG